MDIDTHTPIPRRLRVRASLQLAGVRLPARLMLLAMGVLLLAGCLIVLGAAIDAAVQIGAGVMVIGGLLLEGEWWGFSTQQIAAIAGTHLLRPKQVALEPHELVIEPAESAPAERRVIRWQPREDRV